MLLEQQASSRKNRLWTGALSPILYPGYREQDRGLARHCWLDEKGWGVVGRRVKQRPSPYGLGGETGCTAQKDLKSVSSYTMGEGRTIRVWFSFLYSVPPRFSLLFRPWVSTFLPLFIFRANSLAPFETLLTSNYLPISLLRHLGTRSQGKGVMTTLASSGWRGVVGL